MTPAEAATHLTTTDPRFAVEEREIRNVVYRTFRNAPDNLREMLRQSAEAQAAADFVVHGARRWSFADYCAVVNRIANALVADRGVQPGDRVAIAMRNCPEMLALIMAIPAIGGVVVFVNAWWTSEELDYAFGDSGAKLVFADAPRLERIRPFVESRGLHAVLTHDDGSGGEDTLSDLLDRAQDDSWPATPVAPDDDFAVMYSSGTTGYPKGVVQTHRGAISAVYSWFMLNEMMLLVEGGGPNATAASGKAPRQTALISTPLFHVTATHPLFLLGIPMGTGFVLMDKWSAEEAVSIIRRENVTRFLGVPTQAAELTATAVRLGVEMPSLEYIGTGGAKRPAAQVAAQQAVCPQASIGTGWGMTETNALGIVIAGPDYVARPEIGGRLIPPLQDMKLLDPQGREVPPGEVGELAVKSPANMRCYLNQPDATAEVLRDGWLHTGDLARVDAEGYVTFVDRKKNIIIRGGENIACLDVEGALHRHPAVVEACAFPVPDERLGEVVGAGIRLAPGSAATAEDLAAFLGAHIARFKIPAHVWLRTEPLPRGATDKLDRRALRAECLAAGLPDVTQQGT